MTNSDTWKSWIDDLPLDGFDEGKDGLQDFITQLEVERDDAMALFHAADKKMRALLSERDSLSAQRDDLLAQNMALKAERDAAMDHNRKLLALVSSLEANQARHEAEVQTAMAGAVRVKPLAWADCTFCGQSASYAETEFGSWMVVGYSGRDGRWAHMDPTGNDSDDDWITKEEAQAAAQADYDARIRAALEPDPERLAKVRELQEACAMLFADYQTSTHHHPDHILIPRTAFDSLRAALSALKGGAA